jgi:hypothetical protein
VRASSDPPSSPSSLHLPLFQFIFCVSTHRSLPYLFFFFALMTFFPLCIIYYLGVVLQPRQIALQLLDQIALSSCGQPHYKHKKKKKVCAYVRVYVEYQWMVGSLTQ